MHSRLTLPLAASALLVAGLTLTACSGGSSTPAATDAVATDAAPTTASSSVAESPESPAPSATEAAAGGSGCPAALVSSLTTMSSAAASFAQATSADLKFPGTLMGIDSGCFISAKVDTGTTKATEILAFVPGGSTTLTQATSELTSGGYKETSASSGTFVKGSDAWVVSDANDSSSAFGTLGSSFGSGTILLVHASIG